MGVSYGFTIQSVSTLTTAAQVYYQALNFLNFNGPNALNGIMSSTITPSYTYNSVNSPINPSARQEHLDLGAVRGQRPGRQRQPD